MIKGKFGEPWSGEEYAFPADFPPERGIFNADDECMATATSMEREARIVSCVNALDGIEDPETEITRLRGERGGDQVSDTGIYDTSRVLDEMIHSLETSGTAMSQATPFGDNQIAAAIRRLREERSNFIAEINGLRSDLDRAEAALEAADRVAETYFGVHPHHQAAIKVYRALRQKPSAGEGE